MTNQESAEPIQLQSANPLDDRLDQLRDLFPEAFTEGKLDLDKFGEAVGQFADDRPERYTFTWAGKRDAIRLLQTPTRATLVPDRDESVNFDDTQHLFIEGDNLEVLKLLYKPYFGRVKMVYIDPPYNTGNDFIYTDNYTDPLGAYLQLTGQADAEGNLLTSNPETSGRYHSAWLSMMYPRLFLARQLLCEDGVIFVSIDDHEVHNLRLLMNEIFGEENFVAQLIWKSRQFMDTRSVTNVSTNHEYVLVYGKGGNLSLRGVERDETKFSNPDCDPRGPWMSRSMLGLATLEQRPNLHYDIVDPATGIAYSPPPNTGWRYAEDRMHSLIEQGCVLFPADPSGRPREKKFRADLLREHVSFPSIIDDVFTADGTAEIREFFGFQVFDFPKPSDLIRRFVEQATSQDDFVVDLFAGSCTTAQAVMQQNRHDGQRRRFVCIQLPESLDKGSEVAKRGFSTVADIGKERIRRVIARMDQPPEGQLPLDTRDTPEDLGLKVFRLALSNFQLWAGTQDRDPDAYANQLSLFTDPLTDGWKPEDVIYEIALKEGFDLNCQIEPVGAHRDAPSLYRVTDLARDQSFTISLAPTLDADTIQALNLTKDDLFICRDIALTDDLAANLALQCRLKTI